MNSPAQASGARERRVLVVDDSLESAHALAIIIEDMGHKVEFALNGYVALELAKTFRPEFVFLDLMMPGINGFEVARRLRKEFGDAIRIIAVTASDDEQYRQQSANAGCDLHLMKPVEPEVIEALLG
jgi:CheY-like chemotaxis protein